MARSTTSFKPGQSGNPAGKPPGRNVSNLIRKRCGDNAERIVTELEAIAFGRKGPRSPEYLHDVFARMKALDRLFERGYGKVPDQVEHGVQDGVRSVKFILEGEAAGDGPVKGG